MFHSAHVYTLATDGIHMKLVRSVGIDPLYGEYRQFPEALPTPNENTCKHLTTIILYSVTLYDELTSDRLF